MYGKKAVTLHPLLRKAAIQQQFTSCAIAKSFGPFVYRLGREIFIL